MGLKKKITKIIARKNNPQIYSIFNTKQSNFYLFATDLPILEHEKNPGVSYENLRKIVHTIVQEVIKLPEFYNQKGFSSVDANQVQSSFEPKIYEDLLATAVINKVISVVAYFFFRKIVGISYSFRLYNLFSLLFTIA